eukprot:1076183-Pyramimonas_sp.AAC.1
MVTCVSSDSGKCYDYFILGKQLLPTVKSARADLESYIFPRRPIYLRLATKAGDICVQRLRCFARLSVYCPIGCRPRSPGYEDFDEKLSTLLQPLE